MTGNNSEPNNNGGNMNPVTPSPNKGRGDSAETNPDTTPTTPTVSINWWLRMAWQPCMFTQHMSQLNCMAIYLCNRKRRVLLLHHHPLRRQSAPIFFMVRLQSTVVITMHTSQTTIVATTSLSQPIARAVNASLALPERRIWMTKGTTR